MACKVRGGHRTPTDGSQTEKAGRLHVARTCLTPPVPASAATVRARSGHQMGARRSRTRPVRYVCVYLSGSTRCTLSFAWDCHSVHSSASQHGPGLVAAYLYLELASDSIPLFLIASEARAEARNSISRLEPSISPEPATTAAENVWTN
jgi:hypothetical protein